MEEQKMVGDESERMRTCLIEEATYDEIDLM